MAPTLVLLPGLDGTGDLFQPLVESLSPRIQPLVLAYPESGGQAYSELATYVLERLPKDRPYVLVGESFSGPVAILVAAARPSGLTGLVLCASFARAPRKRVAQVLARVFPLAPLGLFACLGGPSLLMGRFRTRVLESLLRRALAKVPKPTLHARSVAVAQVDVTAALAALELPIMYLQASEDLVVPPSAATTVARFAKRARLEVVVAPHFLLQCAPDPAARVIEEFASDVPCGV